MKAENEIEEREEKEEKEEVLKIKNRLLKPEERKVYGNRYIDEYEYNKSGTNGILDISPVVVKFQGFEVNKKQKLKTLVINKSKFSQRITILPPTTPFFKIQFTRKGLIPSGLAETIYISFFPQKYQYYYDYIRIHCEGDKMLIPIHAYPRLDLETKQYIPKFINFGIVPLSSVDQKIINIPNKVPVGFEFELVPIAECDELNVSPLYGEIEGQSSSNIIIKFNPQSHGSFNAEYELRLSEYDHKPERVKIFGVCNVFSKVGNEDIQKLVAESNLSKFSKSIKKESDEHDKTSLPQIQEILTPENKQFKENLSFSQKSDKGLSKKFKIFPSNKEREFLNYFNQVSTLINDKEIKYIRFIGKPLLTEEENTLILATRHLDFENESKMKRTVDVNRHDFEFDSVKCEVKQNNEFLLKPTFDFNTNDRFFKTRHYYKRFLKMMTKVLISNRAEKRLSCLKSMISNEGIKSTKDFADFMDKDWENYLTQDLQTEEYSVKARFVNPNMLSRTPVYLSYEYNTESLKQEIAHENNIAFDELKHYTPIDRNNIEFLGYREYKSNGMTLYEISTEDKTVRSGAESENSILGERGDSEMSFDKIIEIVEMPNSYKNHVLTSIDTLLFSNPSLKKYHQYPEYPETSIDYNLQPRAIKPAQELFHSHYAYEVNDRFQFSIFETMPVRELDENYLLCDPSLDFIPERMNSCDEKNLHVKKNEFVDEDNYIAEIHIKDDESKLIEEFEKDDEVMKQIRDLNKYEVHDPVENKKKEVENNIQLQKEKWMSTIPTILEFYNSGIVNPENKLVL